MPGVLGLEATHTKAKRAEHPSCIMYAYIRHIHYIQMYNMYNSFASITYNIYNIYEQASTPNAHHASCMHTYDTCIYVCIHTYLHLYNIYMFGIRGLAEGY